MLYMLSALPLLAAASLAALEVYVGPGGNDANPGTAKQPFASFARGRDAARQAVGAGLTADVTVLMAAGTYELAEPLLFGP